MHFIKILLFFGFFNVPWAKAQIFSPLDSMTVKNVSQLQKDYEELKERLPNSFIAAMPYSIGLSSLEKSKAGSLDLICLPDGNFNFGESHASLGYTTHDENRLGDQAIIFLHEDLISGQETKGCTQKQILRLRNMTLIHELSHIYDIFSTKNSLLIEKKSNLGSLCNTSLAKQPYTCLRQKRVSDDLQFMLLAGFKPILISDRGKPGSTEIKIDQLYFERMNIFTERSPRSYEFTSPQEFFAVNMEYFIFDPEYKCRRPALFQYLKNHFKFDPNPHEACRQNQFEIFNSQSKFISLDPSRIYQVHYMTTAKGTQIQSMWGHSLLRLIVCAPERQEVTSECLKDINYHIVVDFSAQLYDQNLSFYGGLTGKYPNGLTFRNFQELRKESLIESERDISSFPLNLTRDQIEMLLNTLREKYWNQISRYFFLQNNCATQILYTLLSAISESKIESSIESYNLVSKGLILTPNTVTKILTRMNLLNQDVPIENENYFTNFKTKIIMDWPKYLDRIGISLESLQNKAPEERLQIYKSVFSTSISNGEKSILKSTFIQAEQLLGVKFNRDLTEFWSQIHKSLIEKNMLAPISLKDSLSPQNPLWLGYGIPFEIEKKHVAILNKMALQREQTMKILINSLSEIEKVKLNQFNLQQQLLKNNIAFLLMED